MTVHPRPLVLEIKAPLFQETMAETVTSLHREVGDHSWEVPPLGRGPAPRYGACVQAEGSARVGCGQQRAGTTILWGLWRQSGHSRRGRGFKFLFTHSGLHFNYVL